MTTYKNFKFDSQGPKLIGYEYVTGFYGPSGVRQKSGENMKNQILIVEDNKALSNGITLTLKDENKEFIRCSNIADARRALERNIPDLVILDVNLPDGDGFEFCKELKKRSDVPVLFLTAKDTEMDEVYGFEVGGSDYITKPFSLAVLRARTEALLRKTGRAESNTDESSYHDGLFDFDFANIKFKRNDVTIELSKTEQKLLYLLISNKNNVVHREHIMSYVWNGSSEFVYENSLSVVIRRLREKLEPDPSAPRYIKTAFGVGYSWVEHCE